MKRYACLLGVLALCLSFATGANAQDTRGSIEGVQCDPISVSSAVPSASESSRLH